MVSVLTPLYNGIEYFEEALLSVLHQTSEDWEMIVGINGHPKGSQTEMLANDIVSKHNANNNFKIRVIYYDTFGKSATLNGMVADAKHKFVALLDADDVWLPEKLEKQAQYLERYDVVGTCCTYFGSRTDRPTVPTGDISRHDIFRFNPIINCSAIIKKELARWDENERRGIEDYDLWFKLFQERRSFYNLPEVLCRHRIHNASAFNNNNHNHVNELQQKWRLLFSQ